jgi:hypothetical protein
MSTLYLQAKAGENASDAVVTLVEPLTSLTVSSAAPDEVAYPGLAGAVSAKKQAIDEFEDQQGTVDVVVLNLHINNVAFDQLNNSAKEGIEDSVCQEVSAHTGVNQMLIKVLLSEGSLKMQIVIPTPANRSAEDVLVAVRGDDKGHGQPGNFKQINDEILALPGLQAAATGALTCKPTVAAIMKAEAIRGQSGEKEIKKEHSDRHFFLVSIICVPISLGLLVALYRWCLSMRRRRNGTEEPSAPLTEAMATADGSITDEVAAKSEDEPDGVAASSAAAEAPAAEGVP